MSVAGVIGLFRANPQHPSGEDGRMALADHLRELRARLLRSVLALVLALILALFFYDQLFNLIYEPFATAQKQLQGKVDTIATINGAAGPLMLQLKLCGVAAIVATSPYWLYQIWAFIVPGLHPHEKRWTRLFAAVAGPLFIVGVGVGYYVLPKGLTVLIGFAGDKLQSLVDFGEYFSFFSRMLLVFGIAFEIPLFVVLLNLAGIVSGKALGQLPALDRGRHVRLRRGGDAVDRPVLDADAGHPDDRAVHDLRGHRPARGPAPAQGVLRRARRRRGVLDRGPATTYAAPACPRTRTDVPVDHAVAPVDPFDLPEWLGTSEVTWTATTSVRGCLAHRRAPSAVAGTTWPATCWPPTWPTRSRCSTTGGGGRPTRRGRTGRCCSWSTTAG